MSFSTKIILFFLIICLVIGGWFLYSEMYSVSATESQKITFEIHDGETVKDLAERLEKKGIIRYTWLFRAYTRIKGIDKTIHKGLYEVEQPITLARVVEALNNQVAGQERSITIIPGWDLNDMAEYFEKEKIATQKDFFALVGEPAVDYRLKTEKIDSFNGKATDEKPDFVSYEGYLAPQTYRIYVDTPIEQIIEKLIAQREKEIEPFLEEIHKQGKSVHEILTMASILEREVRNPEDKAKVADIFWRRNEKGWAMQADSTVHYATEKKGDLFTTKKQRDFDSLWNTYKYPSLPPGPISTPSVDSIRAAVYPQKNDAWYFLTTLQGEVKYGRTLDEHNQNVYKYLR